jgi:hypothetical protein
MADVTTSQQQAEAMNDEMAQQMRRSRLERPERRRGETTPLIERRQVCAFCFQPGDHRTPTACLYALERRADHK